RIRGVARELLLDAVLVGRRMLDHLELGMRREHLVVHAADPMPPRADLAVRHREQISSERRAEALEHLLRRVERDAADQQKLTTPAALPCLRHGGQWGLPKSPLHMTRTVHKYLCPSAADQSSHPIPEPHPDQAPNIERRARWRPRSRAMPDRENCARLYFGNTFSKKHDPQRSCLA